MNEVSSSVRTAPRRGSDLQARTRAVAGDNHRGLANTRRRPRSHPPASAMLDVTSFPPGRQVTWNASHASPLSPPAPRP